MPVDPNIPQPVMQQPGMPQATPPQVPVQQPGAVQQFFTNPENLAAGLVFLASLAQPKQQGQSNFGAFAQRAVGGVALKGALQNQIKASRTADEELARKRLADSRAQELEAQRNQIAQSGVDVNRSEITSREKLSQAEIAARQKLQETPQAITPEQADYLRSEAQRNRAQAQGAGAGETPQDKMFADTLKSIVAGEVQQAQLEGRPIDPARIIEPVQNLRAAMGTLSQIPGARVVRGSDGILRIDLGDGGATPVPGASPAAVATGAPTPPTPFPSLSEAVSQQRSDVRAAALRRTTAQPTADAAAIAEQLPELKGLTDAQLKELAKNPKLTKDQLRVIGQERKNRAQETFKNMKPAFGSAKGS